MFNFDMILLHPRVCRSVTVSVNQKASSALQGDSNSRDIKITICNKLNEVIEFLYTVGQNPHLMAFFFLRVSLI